MRFRKKPVVIEAHHWTVKNYEEIEAFMHHSPELSGLANDVLVIPTLEGEMHAKPGDWIIRGVKGEFYPCKPDIFAATYERVDDASPDH